MTVQPLRGAIAVLLLSATMTAQCGDVNAALEELSEARRLATNLHLQFTKASDAANRAVMASTDESSAAFAKEAEQASDAVETQLQALGPLLQKLDYTHELQLLDRFGAKFAEYRKLDRRILDLAVQNTNVKAQQIAFGAAQAAVDQFRAAIGAAAHAEQARDRWQVEALARRAVEAILEIQVLQAAHIPAADAAVMTGFEARMQAAEADTRASIASLAPLVPPASRARLAAATAALDRFVGLNAEIVKLSRSNTNVYSLALTLDEKRKLVGPCEDLLRSLQEALGKRGYPKGRV